MTNLETLAKDDDKVVQFTLPVSQDLPKSLNEKSNLNFSNNVSQMRPLSEIAYFFFGDALLGGIAVGVISYVSMMRDPTVETYPSLILSLSMGLLATLAGYDAKRQTILYKQKSDFSLTTCEYYRSALLPQTEKQNAKTNVYVA